MWTKANAGKKAKDISYLLSTYWGRLLSTCGCWFFWDFSFYGNKVFQSEFITILSPVRIICLCMPNHVGPFREGFHVSIRGASHPVSRLTVVQVGPLPEPLHAQSAGITTTLAWTLLNSGVALIGYYFTAALVDNIYWGRVRIQLVGFTMVQLWPQPPKAALLMFCGAPHDTVCQHISMCHGNQQVQHGVSCRCRSCFSSQLPSTPP